MKPDSASASQKKAGTMTALDAEQSVLSRPLYSGILANTGMFRAFRGKNRIFSLRSRMRGGEGGIRTPGTLSGTPVFKTGAINHSATSPDDAGCAAS